ncbi:MAG: hypothetical protein HYS58_04080, partial [Elusimicrobia bacterium]|nr:hypothetical protein [Elusimicrobiota bacterium]
PPTDPTQQGTFKDLGESSKERDYKFDKSSYPGFTYMRSGYGENANVTVVYRSGNQLVKIMKSRGGISLDVKSGEGNGMSFARYGFQANYDKYPTDPDGVEVKQGDTVISGGPLKAGDPDYSKITGYSFSLKVKKNNQISTQTVYHGQKDSNRDVTTWNDKPGTKTDGTPATTGTYDSGIDEPTGYGEIKDTKIIISTTKFVKDSMVPNSGTISKYSSSRSRNGSEWTNQSFSVFTKELGGTGYTKGVMSGYGKEGMAITAIGSDAGNNVMRATVIVDRDKMAANASDWFKDLGEETKKEYTFSKSADGSVVTVTGSTEKTAGITFRFTRDGGSANIEQFGKNFNARLSGLAGDVSLDGSDANYEYTHATAGFGGGDLSGVVSSLFGEVNFSSVLSLIDFSKDENNALMEEIATGLGLVKKGAFSQVPAKKIAAVETQFEILPNQDVSIIPQTDAKSIAASLQNSPVLQGVNLENVQFVTMSDGIHITIKDGNSSVSGVISHPTLVKNADGTSKVSWDLRMDRSDTIGFSTRQEVTVTYDYNATGQLIAARGQGNFRTDDGFGNITTGTLNQSYEILKGQAKMVQSISQSHNMNLDGSVQDQTITTANDYDVNTLQLVSVRGNGNFVSDDGFGNKIQGTISQVYDPVLIQKFGRALMTKTVTVTDNAHDENGNLVPGGLDGVSSHQEMTVEYTYNEKGHLAAASGSGFVNGDDGFGNITKAVIAQTYDSKLIERFGKALLVESKTHTDNARFEDSNMDGSSQIQDVTVTYTYDSRGRLEKAVGGGTVTSDDGFGNLSSGNITQTYFILRGQAKLASSLTESDAVNLD